MKIIHLISGLTDGGAEAVLFQLCKFGSQEHIVVSFQNEGKYGSLLKKENVRVICLNMQKANILSSFKMLISILKKEEPDVVQTWMYHANFLGGLACKLSGIDNIFWGVHNSDPLSHSIKKSTRLLVILSAWLSKFLPKKIICCSIKAAERHKEIGYSGVKFEIVPNGYDLNKFFPDNNKRISIRNEFSISDDTYLLGMVARYNPQKDHENLLNALSLVKAKIKNIKVLLVGQNINTENKKIVNLIKDLSLEDLIILADVRSDIASIMNGIDIHVLSSHAEAFPNVLSEAMACGTPCVSTNVGDAKIILGENGILVPARNPQQLAEGILNMVTEIEKVENPAIKRDEIHKYIKNNFSVEKMTVEYERIWADAII